MLRNQQSLINNGTGTFPCDDPTGQYYCPDVLGSCCEEVYAGIVVYVCFPQYNLTGCTTH